MGEKGIGQGGLATPGVMAAPPPSQTIGEAAGDGADMAPKPDEGPSAGEAAAEVVADVLDPLGLHKLF